MPKGLLALYEPPGAAPRVTEGASRAPHLHESLRQVLESPRPGDLRGALVLFVVALLTAGRLRLRSDFRELLAAGGPQLKALQQIGDRIGPRSTLVMAVEGPDPRANERFAEALVANLRPLVGRDLRAIDYRPDATRPFYEHNKILYAELGDLRRADDDLKKLLVSKKNPAFVPSPIPTSARRRTIRRPI